MKKLLIVLLFTFLSSCNSFNTYRYEVEITYFNGEKESMIVTDSPKLKLDHGDLKSGYKTMRSNVRKFKIIKEEKE